MKRGNSRAKELTMEIIVGTFVFVVLLGLAMFTIVLSSENVFKSGTRFEAVFPSVMGLRNGDNVVVRGMIVGTVKDLFLKPDGVHVISSIDKNYKLDMRENYSIKISATSVLGGRLMEITEGTQDSPVIENQETYLFKGKLPTDLVDGASDVVDMIKTALEEGGITENIQITLANLRDITDKINTGEGALAKLINEPDLYNDAAKIVNEIKTALVEREMLKKIEDAVANLNEISEKINEGDGTLAKLINDPSLFDEAADTLAALKQLVADPSLGENLSRSLANLKDITDKINEGEGTIARLINDEELYTEVKRLVTEARATVDDLRETSPLTTFSSIFFGAF
ncbi:MAG: MCE family protein [Lentisphaerae bacterium]|nr:MCE family protein [Lentisphaerota bacterium]